MAGWFDSVTGFLSDNSDWLKPVVNAGLGAYQQANKSGAQQSYADLLRSAEQQNYDNQKAAYEANQAAQAQNYANNQAARAPNQAAARATQASKNAAERKAAKIQQKYYEEAQGLLRPYAETSARLLPQVEQAYGSSLSGLGSLLAELQNPKNMAKMNGSVPAYSVPLEIPAYLRGGK